MEKIAYNLHLLVNNFDEPYLYPFIIFLKARRQPKCLKQVEKAIRILLYLHPIYSIIL